MVIFNHLFWKNGYAFVSTMTFDLNYIIFLKYSMFIAYTWFPVYPFGNFFDVYSVVLQGFALSPLTRT